MKFIRAKSICYGLTRITLGGGNMLEREAELIVMLQTGKLD